MNTAIEYIIFVLDNHQKINPDVLVNMFKNIDIDQYFVDTIMQLIQLYTQISSIYNNSQIMSQFINATKYSILNKKVETFTQLPYRDTFVLFYNLFMNLTNTLVEFMSGKSSIRPATITRYLQDTILGHVVAKYDYYFHGFPQVTQKGHFLPLDNTKHSKNYVFNLLLLPDGKFASSSPDRIVRIWNHKSFGEPQTSIPVDFRARLLMRMQLLPQGRIAILNSFEGVKILNQQGVQASILRGMGMTNLMEVLEDGRLVTASNIINPLLPLSGTIRVWDWEFTQSEITIPAHTEAISALVIYKNKIITGSRDTTIKIWNLESKDPERILAGHTDSVTALIMLPGGRLASGSGDDTIRIWNIQTGQCELILTGHSPRRFLILHDGRLLSISGGGFRIWNTSTGNCDFIYEKFRGPLAILPNGDIIGFPRDNIIIVWSPEHLLVPRIIPTHNEDRITAILVMPDGRVVTGSTQIIIWE